MTRNDVDHLQAVRLIATSRNRMTKHQLFFDIMHAWIELKFSDAAHVVDRPAGECTRHRDDVLLRVASIHTESVKFQKLPAVIFVKAPASPWVRRGKILPRSLRLP